MGKNDRISDFRIDPEKKTEWERFAQKENRSMTGFITNAVNTYIKQKKEDERFYPFRDFSWKKFLGILEEDRNGDR